MRAATFTTYINAKEDPGLEAAFTRQARIAQSSYATITRAAEQATRATAGLLGGRGTAGGGAANAQIQQRVAATRNVVTAAAAAERATLKLATATKREATEATNAARANSTLARSLTTTATALNVVQGPLGPIAGRLGALSRAVTELTGARLGLAAFGASLFALGRTANTYANLEGRVRPFFETQKQVNAAMNDIIGIAQRSRAALEPVVDVYTRLTTVGQNIGLTRQGIGQVTEIATKAASVGGGSAQARDAALMQFGQALSGDFKAAGQEINSLKEQAPILFQAILRGYKDVDGTVGVTLGRFKQMSEAGELSTAKVLDAVRRSSSYIDQMAGRVPNTLSRAGTDFVNSVTVMFGRFDQAIGFTSTLADGLSLVAANLRVITGLALGAGAAFAGMKLVGLVSETAAALRGTVIMSAAIKELGIRRQTNAAASVAQHQREIAALNAEQREIQQNIALLERQRAAASRDTARVGRDLMAGAPGAGRAAAQAAQAERAAVRALIQEKQRLGIITGALTAAQLRAQTSQARLEVATSNITKRMGLFRSALGSVVGFLGGPWAIAFAVATTAIYLLATAETAAEKATRQHEDAQRSFASIVDRTTGKVYDQISALQRLDVQRKASNDVAATGQQTDQSKDQIVRSLIPLLAKGGARREFQTVNGFRVLVNTGDRRTPEQKELQEAVRSFNRLERGSIPRLEALLADPRIRRGVPGLESQIGGITGQFGQFNENRERLSQSASARRVLQGRGTPEDVARAFGEPTRTTTGGAKPLSKAQIDANARAQAAQTDVERAKAELAQVKAGGKQAGEDDAAYQNRLAQAYTNVKQAVDGEAAARKAASAGRAEARRDAADAKREAAEREREARQAARDAAQGKRDDAQQNLEEMAPALSRQAYLDKRIEILQTYDDEMNAIESGARASNTADRQRISDSREVAAARRDITTSFENEMAVNRLILLGQTTEAEALRRTLDLRERIGDKANDLRPVIEGQLRQENLINDALASRERIVGLITGALDQARDTTEGFLTELQTGGNVGNAFKTAFKDFQTQFARINSRQLVEKLFAGSDEKLRAMLSGKSSVDSAIDQFGTSVDSLSTQTTRGETAVEKFATAAENAAVRLTAIGNGGAAITGAGGTAETSGVASAAALAARSVGAALGLASGSFAPASDNDNQDIVVEGQRVKKGMAPLVQAATPTARQVYNNIGTSLFTPIGKGLDSLVDKVKGTTTSIAADGTKVGGSTFFKNLSGAFGTALQGAGEGAIASGFAKALGVKQSSTGAQIGGAIGAATGIPGGSIIGGLLGGTIGGLFMKPKSGSASVSLNQYGEAIGGTGAGNSTATRAQATGAAKSVADGINAIASQLGATISGLPGVTIGTFDGKARVATTNTSKSLNYNNFNSSNLKDFGKDGEAAAIEYAIRYSIGNAVIDGISQASKNIIKSGQDLQQAINKALAIESIPKRLMQLTDPVRYAVSTLNDEFTKLISYLKEGGATAEQYADAQKLYDLERQNAIEAATQQAADAIDQFLKDMVGSSASPLNKRTTYDNAAKDLNDFKASIASGKTVDQNDLLNAARNFQDASRTLNGSSSAFFDDFEMLRSLLAKARDNAGMTDVTTLPGSPFSSDSAVQAAIASLQNASTAATRSQTDALISKLDQVVGAIDRQGVGGGGGSGYSDSSVGLLPAFKGREAVDYR